MAAGWLPDPPDGRTPEIAAPSDASNPDSPADPARPPAGDPEHPGYPIYITYCAACHGARGEGQPDWKVPREDGSLPAPPHDVSGHTWHHADAQLLEIIAEGGVVYMPESQMPGYAGVLSADEMQAVLGYIKTLWGPRELDFQEEATRSWDAAIEAEGGATESPSP